MILVGIGVLMSSACLPPRNYVRRTVVAPLAAASARVGRPLEAGELQLSGQIELSTFPPDDEAATAYDGDAGVRIPRTYFGGGAHFGLTPHLELGVDAAHGPTRAAYANNQYVPEFEGAPSLRLSGSVRATIRTRTRMAYSFLAEVGGARVSQGRFVCGDGSGNCEDPLEFDLADQTARWMPDVAVLVEPVFLRDEHVAVFWHIGISTGVRNSGFDEIPDRTGTTLETYPNLVMGGGLDLQQGHWFTTLGGDTIYPAVFEIPPAIAFTVSTGVRFPARRDRPREPVRALQNDR